MSEEKKPRTVRHRYTFQEDELFAKLFGKQIIDQEKDVPSWQDIYNEGSKNIKSLFSLNSNDIGNHCRSVGLTSCHSWDQINEWIAKRKKKAEKKLKNSKKRKISEIDDDDDNYSGGNGQKFENVNKNEEKKEAIKEEVGSDEDSPDDTNDTDDSDEEFNDQYEEEKENSNKSNSKSNQFIPKELKNEKIYEQKQFGDLLIVSQPVEGILLGYRLYESEKYGFIFWSMIHNYKISFVLHNINKLIISIIETSLSNETKEELKTLNELKGKIDYDELNHPISERNSTIEIILPFPVTEVEHVVGKTVWGFLLKKKLKVEHKTLEFN